MTSKTGYSPVRSGDDGTYEVELDADHPGFADPDYRARRNALAGLAAGWERGAPIPVPEYTDVEHEVWRIVSAALRDKHAEYATQSYLDSTEALGLPVDRIPQLPDVSALLQPLTGFQYLPVAGLAPLREFYGSFADGVFFSTQYIRHHSVPLYTPEPDIVHEVIGHANQLADPRFAELYRRVGQVTPTLETPEALAALSKVFWFTVEFGVVHERGALRTYGAGILSSVGELDHFRSVEVRPLDFGAMATLEYDITHYQPVLFVARSVEEVLDELAAFLDGLTDESAARLLADAAA